MQCCFFLRTQWSIRCIVTHSCHLVENFFEVMFNASHLSFIIWWEHKAFITHVQQHFSMLLCSLELIMRVSLTKSSDMLFFFCFNECMKFCMLPVWLLKFLGLYFHWNWIWSLFLFSFVYFDCWNVVISRTRQSQTNEQWD